jgi:Lon protease-like protein
MEEIGLFPLGLVLLPGERVPLHIFEPRYRELIGECLETQGEFGLVAGTDAEIAAVGTRAAPTEVAERYPDGRLDIVVDGRERFHILEETAGRSFRTARIAPFVDEDDDPSEEEVGRCLATFRAALKAAGAEPFEPEPGDEGLAFWMAARIDFSVEAKQELLELSSERARVLRLTELLVGAVRALRYAKLASERAAGNGRVEPPG